MHSVDVHLFLWERNNNTTYRIPTWRRDPIFGKPWFVWLEAKPSKGSEAKHVHGRGCNGNMWTMFLSWISRLNTRWWQPFGAVRWAFDKTMKTKCRHFHKPKILERGREIKKWMWSSLMHKGRRKKKESNVPTNRCGSGTKNHGPRGWEDDERIDLEHLNERHCVQKLFSCFWCVKRKSKLEEDV